MSHSAPRRGFIRAKRTGAGAAQPRCCCQRPSFHTCTGSPRVASLLHLAGKLFDPLGTPDGGMVVRLLGEDANGAPLQLAWHIFAPDHHGPEIPCMAAILLARRLARGDTLQPGARPCMGMVTLDEFAPEFMRWGMATDVVMEDAHGA